MKNKDNVLYHIIQLSYCIISASINAFKISTASYGPETNVNKEITQIVGNGLQFLIVLKNVLELCGNGENLSLKTCCKDEATDSQQFIGGLVRTGIAGINLTNIIIDLSSEDGFKKDEKVFLNICGLGAIIPEVHNTLIGLSQIIEGISESFGEESRKAVQDFRVKIHLKSSSQEPRRKDNEITEQQFAEIKKEMERRENFAKITKNL